MGNIWGIAPFRIYMSFCRRFVAVTTAMSEFN